MAQGLFTLRQQVQGIVQKAWNTPVGTYAGSFNGTSQYLTTTMTGQTFGTGDFTVEFWVNPASIATSDIIDTRSAGDSINAYSVQFDGTNLNWANTANYLSVPVSNFPLGKWTHVAYTRVSGTMKVYVNGTQYGSSITLASDYTNTRLDIGIAVRTYYFSGFISNIRLVRGTAIYTSNFAPPVGPLAAVSGTALLTLQNATIVDNSTNAFTITNTGSVTTGAAMPFTQLSTPAVDYLVVAGGGGGSQGGGGAGGLLQGSVPVTAGSSLTVTVGGGGGAYTQGSNSVFSSITTIGGGAAASGTGGSGGGGNNAAGQQGTFGQGNTGGTGSATASPYAGGGGGGAGTVGLNATSTVAGNGGAGIGSAISGTVTTYAGGAGGGGPTNGTGGVGGGGAGDANGTANTGGGGGGGYAGGPKTGGSGIVIVSYPDIYAGAAATTGSPTVSTTGSGSIAFTGSTSVYTNVTTNTSSFAFATGDFTIEFWIYTNSSGTYTIYDSRALGVNDLSPTIYLSSNSITFYTNGADRINGGTLANATWNHIALVKISGSTKLYLNGVQTGSTYTDGNTYINSSNRPYIGSGSIVVGQNPLNGYLTNVRVVKGLGVYTGAFTPSTTPLTATQPAGTNIAAISGTSTSLLLNSVSGAYLGDSSTFSNTLAVSTTPAWNQLSPFATGLGYKNRVYTYTASGTITF